MLSGWQQRQTPGLSGESRGSPGLLLPSYQGRVTEGSEGTQAPSPPCGPSLSLGDATVALWVPGPSRRRPTHF
jgi:hypothetical protein